MQLLRANSLHRMTAADLADILSSGWGTKKQVQEREYYVVLNKCDDELRRQQGEEIDAAIKAVQTLAQEDE